MVGNNICQLVDILSHIIKISIINPINAIIDPIDDITFHAIYASEYRRNIPANPKNWAHNHK